MSRALVLNASFEPLAVVALNRAVVLVLTEKADIIEANGEMRSASTSVAAPTVIRLRRYVKVPYRSRAPLTKRNVLARDGHRCVYCHKSGDTLDHVVPRSRGGAHSWENIVTACFRCNQRKADHTLAELGWKLPQVPKAPTGRSWVILAVADMDPAWEQWLADHRSDPHVSFAGT